MATDTLPGRLRECAVLDGLLDGVRHGHGGVLVLRGAAGTGKTALLDRAAGHAPDLRPIRVCAVEAEHRLDFAVLHQLCTPVLDRLRYLPAPQHDALAVAFGMRTGPVPDPFLVGLAVLSLLSEAGRRRPLVGTVDDAHWLDPASARALAFAARRLGPEPVVLLFAAREPGAELAALPGLVVEGLRDADARAVLDSALRWPLDEQVRERFLAETRGNPAALLDPPGRYAGGFGVPDGPDPAGDPLGGLPAPSRRLVRLAAADPTGDPALVWRAAGRLGIPPDAAVPAVEAGLVEFGTRVRFRDPRVRAAAYRTAPLRDRQQAHRTLAESTDPDLDPDRRAWHRADAAPGPDAEVADELERYADRARVRAGLAARAAFLERAATLTPEPARRTERALAAAGAQIEAGYPDVATRLVAPVVPVTVEQRARVDAVRGRLAYATGRYRDAVPLLLDAAHRLAPAEARSVYLEAWCAALLAGRLAVPGADLSAVIASAHDPLVAGTPAGVPALQRVLATLARHEPDADALPRLWPAITAAAYLWDTTAWDALSRRYLCLARESGALAALPLALTARAYREVFAGELDAAGALVEELPVAYRATGAEPAPYAALGLAALRGCDDATVALSATVRREAVARGDGLGLTAAHWAEALLCNGSGRYEQALVAAEQGTRDPTGLGPAAWSAVELVEAAARCAEPERATVALQGIASLARASGTDGALGVAARCRALLAPDAAAEDGYREAVERLARTPLRVDLARAHLVYGEWLRRGNRRLDARGQLRTGYDMLAGMGVEAFAERARRELLATGETVRKRTVATVTELTAQEAQIARLAREGLSNPEISTRLFISPRTVEWHLRKVFSKLDISSRRQLRALSV